LSPQHIKCLVSSIGAGCAVVLPVTLIAAEVVDEATTLSTYLQSAAEGNQLSRSGGRTDQLLPGKAKHGDRLFWGVVMTVRCSVRRTRYSGKRYPVYFFKVQGQERLTATPSWKYNVEQAIHQRRESGQPWRNRCKWWS